MSARVVDIPAAFQVWRCGRCQHELVVSRTCPCCDPEMECINCDARFDPDTGECRGIGGRP